MVDLLDPRHGLHLVAGMDSDRAHSEELLALIASLDLTSHVRRVGSEPESGAWWSKGM